MDHSDAVAEFTPANNVRVMSETMWYDRAIFPYCAPIPNYDVAIHCPCVSIDWHLKIARRISSMESAVSDLALPVSPCVRECSGLDAEALAAVL